jgi:hypothetical protein
MKAFFFNQASMLSMILIFSASAYANPQLLTTQNCQQAVGQYLDLTPVFVDYDNHELLGMSAVWDEDLYLVQKGPIAILFSSEKVQYLYYEGSDVGSEVLRCEVQTGTISRPLKPYSHYASCADVNEAIAAEKDPGAIQFDYCKDHPDDE